MIDFSNVKSLKIPEGEVAKIECNGVVLWQAGQTNLFSVNRAYSTTPSSSSFLATTDTRDLDYSKYYAVDYQGRRGTYCDSKLKSHSMLADRNGFVYQVTSSSGYGLEFPIAVDGGKTYELKCSFETNSTDIWLVRYNNDTTFSSITKILAAQAEFYEQVLRFTTEPEYLYSLAFTKAKANADISAINISLVYIPSENWEYKVPDLASCARCIPTSATSIGMSNDWLTIACSTQNTYAMTDREGNTRWAIPVPEMATAFNITTSDMGFERWYCYGGKSGATVINTGELAFNPSTGCTYHFEKGSIDYILLGLAYSSDKKVAWGYDISQVEVVFTND